MLLVWLTPRYHCTGVFGWWSSW